jgi:predicted DNA-binding mobile mystery protein A
MTMEQLATRLRISAPAIADLERRESEGTVSVAKLREAADALGCDLVVAFVPRIPLDEMVQRQAAMKAQQQRDRLLHTMRLEGQEEGVTPSPSVEVESLMSGRGSRIWD